jgi:hypothetical protein
MLLQTNSYIVPKDKRNEHARLLRRFRQTLMRLGCDHFEVFEQVGANWNSQEATNRFVQIMRFRDRRHQLEVQTAERSDPVAQQLVMEFCNLINFKYQQEQGLFAVGFYTSFLRMPTASPHDAAQQSGPRSALDRDEEDDDPTPESIAAMRAAMANSPEPGVMSTSPAPAVDPRHGEPDADVEARADADHADGHVDRAVPRVNGAENDAAPAGMSLSGRWTDQPAASSAAPGQVDPSEAGDVAADDESGQS